MKHILHTLSSFFLIIFITFNLSCSNNNSENDKPGLNKEAQQEKTFEQDNHQKFNPDLIHARRKEKDSMFSQENSPLTEDLKAEFKGLKYYTPSEKYFVEAKLEIFENPDTVEILTTKSNDIRKMLRYGKFHFSIDSEQCELTAYRVLPVEISDMLFVPFKDSTCSNGSYEGGRYLDIELNKNSDNYVINFNYAYNPYCAYNMKYSCPLVPDENYLDVAIKAGEKNYKKQMKPLGY